MIEDLGRVAVLSQRAGDEIGKILFIFYNDYVRHRSTHPSILINTRHRKRQAPQAITAACRVQCTESGDQNRVFGMPGMPGRGGDGGATFGMAGWFASVREGCCLLYTSDAADDLTRVD